MRMSWKRERLVVEEKRGEKKNVGSGFWWRRGCRDPKETKRKDEILVSYPSFFSSFPTFCFFRYPKRSWCGVAGRQAARRAPNYETINNVVRVMTKSIPMEPLR